MSAVISQRREDASRRGWQYRLHIDAPLLLALVGVSGLGLMVLYSAGGEDMDLLGRTNVGRDVNRHYYTPGELESELDRPGVRALCNLIRLRNWHSAFDGEFTTSGDATTLAMAWRAGGESARLTIDFEARSAGLDWTVNGQQHSVARLMDLPDIPGER